MENKKYLPLPDLTPLLEKKQKRIEDQIQESQNDLIEMEKVVEEAISNSRRHKLELETRNKHLLDLDKLTEALEKKLQDIQEETKKC